MALHPSDPAPRFSAEREPEQSEDDEDDPMDVDQFDEMPESSSQDRPGTSHEKERKRRNAINWRQNMADMRRRHEALTDESKQLEQESARLQQTLQAVNKQIAEREAEVMRLHRENGSLTAKTCGIRIPPYMEHRNSPDTQQMLPLKERKRRNSKLWRARLAKIRHQVPILERRKEALTLDNRSLTEKISTSRKRSQDLERQIAQILHENASLQITVTILEQEIARREAQHTDWHLWASL